MRAGPADTCSQDHTDRKRHICLVKNHDKSWCSCLMMEDWTAVEEPRGEYERKEVTVDVKCVILKLGDVSESNERFPQKSTWEAGEEKKMNKPASECHTSSLLIACHQRSLLVRYSTLHFVWEGEGSAAGPSIWSSERRLHKQGEGEPVIWENHAERTTRVFTLRRSERLLPSPRWLAGWKVILPPAPSIH